MYKIELISVYRARFVHELYCLSLADYVSNNSTRFVDSKHNNLVCISDLSSHTG